MVDRLRLATAVDAQLVGNFRVGDVPEVFVHDDARLADLAELERATHEEPLTAGHAGDLFALVDELLKMELIELWLGVESVDVARSPLHEQHDYGLRPRREVRLLHRQRL